MLLCTSCSRSPRHYTSGRGVYHTVKPGQTLYRISLTYDVPLKLVRSVNGITDPSQIKVGQKIFIPGVSKVLHVKVIRPARIPTYSLLPVKGNISSHFGVPRSGGRHTGVDISAPRGTPILATFAGIVTFSGKMRGYGNTIIIDHGNGIESLYGHNYKNLVSEGKNVYKDDQIALVGRSGNASGYHLHFEIRVNGKPIDPLAYLTR